ncbi:hypothetical protein JAAARDRAFT_188552 [Jaapia argillacea MUCL 33604]|uniref:AB hydrolase-1 domain-containing protein n=1 Tax=Jaapia argillacea MUCL 33604 TaxID=933084 RepID=A0A067Q793_9AGAM|nr:hypothetical protein JAAARDRAFT_188552 [Jaapia argillacea MUCL 33604]
MPVIPREKVEYSDDKLPLHSYGGQSEGWTSSRRLPSQWIFRLLSFGALAYIALKDGHISSSKGLEVLNSGFGFLSPTSNLVGGVEWKSCGEGFDGFQCANISLPLDYHNDSDPRTVTISVNRFLATNTTHREGAVFINPGGPGGSGSSMGFTKGPYISKIFKGRYDIIGFDPRGVNQSQPYTSCFENQLDGDVFSALVDGLELNLPANMTLDSMRDLTNQLTRRVAEFTALSAKCYERTGDVLSYFGTEAVIRDIDSLSKIIEGENARINYWGFSYGTIVGQYLVKILPPSRIGRIMIDGVVNPDIYSDYPVKTFDNYLIDLNNVLTSFASSCSSAGEGCVLSHLKPTEILAKIDDTIDYLYYNPVPITDLRVPTILTASHLRGMLFQDMYKIQTWPQLAEHLDQAFKGNFSGIASATMPTVHGDGYQKHDGSNYAHQAILCADMKPYSADHPPPTIAELVEYIVDALIEYGPRFGDKFYSWSLCGIWQDTVPQKSRYEGSFKLVNNTLDTPVLVLSNTFDPVTPLLNAEYANERLGNNARLVQQVDGWGHCTISQKSFCTAEIIHAYMVEGKVPEQKHTLCDIDEEPFKPFNDTVFASAQKGVDTELRQAWMQLTDGWEWD